MRKPPVTILFSAAANREIDEARAWWAKHVGVAPFADGVEAALRLIEAFPEAAPRVKIRGRWSRTRRASVAVVGYHIYYRYDVRTGIVFVQRFWHERRRPPRL